MALTSDSHTACTYQKMATPSAGEGRTEPATSKTEAKAESSEGAGAAKTTGKASRLWLVVIRQFSI